MYTFKNKDAAAGGPPVKLPVSPSTDGTTPSPAPAPSTDGE